MQYLVYDIEANDCIVVDMDNQTTTSWMYLKDLIEPFSQHNEIRNQSTTIKDWVEYEEKDDSAAPGTYQVLFKTEEITPEFLEKEYPELFI